MVSINESIRAGYARTARAWKERQQLLKSLLGETTSCIVTVEYPQEGAPGFLALYRHSEASDVFGCWGATQEEAVRNLRRTYTSIPTPGVVSHRVTV